MDITSATSAQMPPRVKRPRWSTLRRRRLLTGLFLSLPGFIGFLIFTLYPMLASFYYSFTEFHIHKAPIWIGFANYTELFNDKLFWTSLGNTFYLVSSASR